MSLPSQSLFAVPTDGGRPAKVLDTGHNPSSFGVDRAGRLYLGDYGGTIYRFEP